MVQYAKFQCGLSRLARNYRTKISKETKTDLWEYLEAKQWTDDEFDSAVEYILDNNKFFPNLAEFNATRPPKNQVWEDKPTGDEPQYHHTAEEDQEILDLIESSISNEKLKATCKRILFRHGPNGVVYSRCSTCGDTGLVEVYHPKSCKRAKANMLRVEDLRTCTIACTCDKAPIEGRRFDADLMPKVTAIGSNEQLQELKDFYQPKYHNEFADWVRN